MRNRRGRFPDRRRPGIQAPAAAPVPPAHPAGAEGASSGSYATRRLWGGRACDFGLFLHSSCYSRDFLVALITVAIKRSRACACLLTRPKALPGGTPCVGFKCAAHVHTRCRASPPGWLSEYVFRINPSEPGAARSPACRGVARTRERGSGSRPRTAGHRAWRRLAMGEACHLAVPPRSGVAHERQPPREGGKPALRSGAPGWAAGLPGRAPGIWLWAAAPLSPR